MPEYKFNVRMTCGGCTGAVKRVLDGTNGVGPGDEKHTEDLDSQIVTVHPDPAELTQEKIDAFYSKPEKERFKEDEPPTFEVIRHRMPKQVNSGEVDGKEQDITKPPTYPLAPRRPSPTSTS